MQKQTKIIIGVGIGVLALSVFLSAKANAMNKKNTNVSTQPPATTTGGARCPTGEIPCSNNPSKCYNPSIDYFVNPCN